MAFFHEKSWREDAEDRVAQQLAHLSREVDSMAQSLRRTGKHAGRDVGHLASDLVDQAWHQGEVVAHNLGRQAVRTGRAVRKDPVPALVAAAGLMLFLTLIFGRRR